jgi:protein CpxP
MKRTHLVTAVVSLMVFAFALNVEARSGRGHRGHKGKGEMSARLCEKLDLSAEQQAKVKNLREETKSETKVLHQKLRELGKEIHWLWNAENPNEDAIMAKIEEMSAVKLELEKISAELRLDINSLLTPEQKAKAVELREQRKERRKEMKEKRGRGQKKSDKSFRGGPCTQIAR